MTNNLRFLLFSLFAFLIIGQTSLTAQSDGTNYNLILQKEQRIVPENFADFLAAKKVPTDELVAGKYYRIVQFFEIPSQEQLGGMERLGIEFLDYFPSRAYVVSFPKNLDRAILKNRGIRAVLPIDSKIKMDKSLVDLDGGHESVHGDRIDVLLRFHKNISMEWVERKLAQEKVQVLKTMEESKLMNVNIDLNDLEKMAALPFVSYLSIMPAKGEPEDRRGMSLHRANMINTEYASGRHYDGEGVGVLVRDDGIVGPHIDFKGRMFNYATSDSPVNHADGVAGIMAGAGNLNPDMRGMASGSDMHVLEYFADFQDNLISLQLHQEADVLVVNSSYSNGCNAGYTSITETVDRHIFENPNFLHVFSAGNSNNNDCDYGAGDQWGNITGGHKQGKNVMATANVYEDGFLAPSSSRGPAHDGRIKPDITANGQNQNSTDPFNQYAPFGGTSGAAPGVAGVSAQLHQVYQELHNGETAPSALIKGTILNTANDMGNIGPDFSYGWGHLNAYRGFKLLEDGRYESSTIAQGGSNAHTLTVPDGAVEVRVMLYWNERSAAPGTGKALVNDLDLVVTDPNGTTQLPWVLDATPNPSTLNLPATNGEDHLNNVEQILFENPVAGSYTIDVSAFEVPFGPQEYYLLYEVITDEITVTYPIGGEGFIPTEDERLRWDAYGNDGFFLIEYTTDDGVTWQTINAGLVGTARMINWDVPNEISGEVRVRVSRNGFSDESDANLSISRRPNNLRTEQFCPNFMTVSWNAVAGATGYDVFYLGDKSMDSVGTTTATEFEIPLPSPFGEHWFSVRAIGENGLRSKRANAVVYDGGLLDCILQNDVATTQLFSPSSSSLVSCDPIQKNISIEIENTSINDQGTLTFGYQIGSAAPVEEAYAGVLSVGEVIEHTFATPVDFPTSGIYELRTWSSIPNDDVFYNDTIYRSIIVSIDDVATINPEFTENFNGNDFPPEDWFASNPDGLFGWELISGIRGADDNFTRAALVRNRFYNRIGERDELFSIPLDLTDVPNPVLSFDLAYALFTNSCSDTLVVELYTECGDVFQEEIYRKSGMDLSTVGLSPTDWYPSEDDDWRTEAAVFTEYAGEEVLLKFINIAGNCNNLMVDNINITNFAAPVASFVASSTTVCVGEEITFNNLSQGALATYSWRFGSWSSNSLSNMRNPSSLFYIQAGEKEVQLIVTNDLGSDTMYQIINVVDDPTARFDVDQTGLGYQFTNESEDATSYLWDFGDNTSSTEENPFKTYQQQGDYNIKLTVYNNCSEDFDFENINVTVTAVEELDEAVQLQIIPNPNDGAFSLKIEDVQERNLDISIFDAQGKLVGEWKTASAQGVVLFPIAQQNLAQGLYFVKVMSEDRVRMLKMAVE